MTIFSIIMALIIGACVGIMFATDQEVKQMDMKDLRKEARLTAILLIIVYVIVWGVWYLG